MDNNLAWSRPCLFLIGAVLSLTGVARGQSDEQSALVEFLKGAQLTNGASLDQGKLVAHVRYRPGKEFPLVELETTVFWNRQGTFWIYKLSDPGKYISPNKFPTEWGAELKDQRTAYRLILGKSIYTYDPFDGQLIILDYGKPVGNLSEREREGRLRSRIFDVLPETNWFQCCPPNHDDGRPWLDMIGPESPALRQDDELTIERSPDGLIRQVRKDADGGTFEVVFSPEYCGNVVEVRYIGTNPRVRSKTGRYEWRKTRDGICVLERCEFRKSAPGRPKDVDIEYALKITFIDLKTKVDSKRISFNALKSYLPPNTEVHERMTGKSYMLNPIPGAAQDQRFRELAEEVRSRGFLKREN